MPIKGKHCRLSMLKLSRQEQVIVLPALAWIGTVLIFESKLEDV